MCTLYIMLSVYIYIYTFYNLYKMDISMGVTLFPHESGNSMGISMAIPWKLLMGFTESVSSSKIASVLILF